MADGDDANKTWQESAIRKEKYKQLLDIGSNAMEELESKSVVENFGRLIEIVQKSNELASEGKLTDRVGQLTEVVLDAQVKRHKNYITLTRLFLTFSIDFIPYQCRCLNWRPI